MHRRRLLALSGSLLVGALAGCSAPEPEDTPQPNLAEPALTPNVEESTLDDLVRETNTFSMDLYREIADESATENGLVSPLSVSTALAMAYAGARGETRTEMASTLNYTLEGPLHETFNALQRALNERSEALDPEALPAKFDESDEPVPFDLSLVNAVWGQEDFPFDDEYRQILADHYGGGLNEVDYRRDPEAARQTINEWVAEQTAARIDELLPKGSLTTLTRLVLTNAVYFKANWQDPFDKADTESGTFTPLDGAPATVPMMHKTGPTAFAKTNGIKAIDLPYLGADVSMLLILPAEGTVRDFEAELDGERVQTIVDSLERQETNVTIPKFSFADSHGLRRALKALGMEAAFEQSAADFSGMADLSGTQKRLYLSQVFHDTDITVDETGTEAAAATGAVVGYTSAPSETAEFVADRPFVFAIRDRPTGAILFLGRVVDAGAAQ